MARVSFLRYRKSNSIQITYKSTVQSIRYSSRHGEYQYSAAGIWIVAVGESSVVEQLVSRAQHAPGATLQYVCVNHRR
jgi:3-deoxy-D-manno-octulosonic-acid transferase